MLPDQNKIMITGTTIGNEVMDNWIERMDRFEWVKSIELINYLKNSDSKSEFTISILLAK